jgi:hypothetical protein
MMRYPIRPSQWRRLIDETSPGWRTRAQERTNRFRAAGRFNDRSPIWSQVKRAYMELQGFKCGFCERRLEKSRFGNVEHDVEHYRPKSSVAAWPSERQRRERDINLDFPFGDAADPGYFLLAYHIENYLIACKTCNSALKSNAFPIDGTRDTTGDAPRDLRGERPFLIYPIGAVDEDPEDLITFEGILPVPVGSRGHKRRRALVTIDFFELDSREVLLEERAEILLGLHVAMAGRDHADAGTRAAADLLIERMIDRRSPHANCARAHHDLMLSDAPRAASIAQAALQFLESLDRD